MSQFEDIHAYCDGELCAEDCCTIEQALSSDPQAKAEYESAVLIKSVLKSKISDCGCDKTWNACCDRLKEVERVRYTNTIVRKYRGALAGVVGLAIVSAVYLGRVSPSRVNGINSFGGTVESSAPLFPGAGTTESGNTISEQTLPQNLQRGEVRVLQRDYLPTNVLRYLLSDGVTKYVVLLSEARETLPGVTIAGIEGVNKLTLYHQNAICWKQDNLQIVVSANRSVEELLQFVQ